MRSLATCLALLCLTATARAQEAAPDEDVASEAAPAEEAPPELPPPTLEGEEPVAPPEPLPVAPGEEESQPQILTRIGPGQHPDWEEDEDGESVPRDIPFETPGDMRSSQGTAEHPQGGQIYSTDPEVPSPPFVLAAGAGFARFLAATPLDFFRIDERFEATIPDFATFRIGASATQMIGENGFLVGGGVRLGLGVPLCDTGDVICDGVVYVQPGFMAGLTGPRFDLNALMSLRLNLFHVAQVAVEGGYSFIADAGNLLFVTGSAGVLF